MENGRGRVTRFLGAFREGVSSIGITYEGHALFAVMPSYVVDNALLWVATDSPLDSACKPLGSIFATLASEIVRPAALCAGLPHPHPRAAIS